MATYFPLILMACLWTGLFCAMWDGGDAFGPAAASFLVALILLLPAAFIAGLVWRYVQIIGDAASWLRDRRRYRRAP